MKPHITCGAADCQYRTVQIWFVAIAKTILVNAFAFYRPRWQISPSIVEGFGMRKLNLIPAVLALLAPIASFAGGESPETKIDIDQSGATINLIPSAEDKSWRDYVGYINGDPRVLVVPHGHQSPPDLFTPPDANSDAAKAALIFFPCPPSQGECGFERTGLTRLETEEFFDDRFDEPVWGDGFESGTTSAFITEY